MGSGKGSPEGWVAVVKPGPRDVRARGCGRAARPEALRLAGNKLAVKTKVVKREGDLFE